MHFRSLENSPRDLFQASTLLITSRANAYRRHIVNIKHVFAKSYLMTNIFFSVPETIWASNEGSNLLSTAQHSALLEIRYCKNLDVFNMEPT